MRAILSIILLLGLTGCVSYPYMMAEDGQGVYYENPADAWGGDDSVVYADALYYPYWSMDYFYLGSGYTHSWYGYYHSPYFYPYYFTVLYPPLHWGPWYGYGHYSAWHDPYWHQRYQHYQAAAYPAHRRPGGRANEAGTLGDASRIGTSEPLEVYQPGLRRTSYGSPGITSTGSMTVVRPSDGKLKQSTVGPTRSTGISASVAPGPGATAVTPQGSLSTPTRSGPRLSSPQRPATPSSRSRSRSPTTGMGRRSSGVERSRSPTRRPGVDRDRD